jgi:hypothetical protein
VIETTSVQLSKRLDEAETAISHRLQQLGSSQKAAAELQALQDARCNLKVMREGLRKS